MGREEPSRQAHHVDISVGRQIRDIRSRRNITQQGLAKMLGVSFQQVQKYEVAGNRISASRLWEMAQVLNVSISDFFSNEELSPQIAALSKESLHVAQELDKVESAELREKIISLVQGCADIYR